MLFKEIVDGRTHERTHGRTPDIEGSQKLTEHFVLRLAKKLVIFQLFVFYKVFCNI